MTKPRFSLASLLFLTTAVAIFLGYSQWRRQHILQLCEDLRTLSVVTTVPNDFIDHIWQRVPINATLMVPIDYIAKGQDELSREQRIVEKRRKLLLDEKSAELGISVKPWGPVY